MISETVHLHIHIKNVLHICIVLPIRMQMLENKFLYTKLQLSEMTLGVNSDILCILLTVKVT